MVSENTKECAQRIYSGAGYIDIRGDKRARERTRIYELPGIDDIILYNEQPECILAGAPGQPPRGIGRVKSYVGYGGSLVMLEVYRSPKYRKLECFHTVDFQLGLVRFCKLSGYIYTEHIAHVDLDLNHPRADIRELYMNPFPDMAVRI